MKGEIHVEMKTFPLPSITVSEAMEMQFRLVDCMTHVFEGHELLTRGELGVMPGHNKPEMTRKVERVLADFFGTEACILVRGAGSGAIRFGLHAALEPGDQILIHKAPVYPTTLTSMKLMGLIPVETDYNQISEIKQVLADHPGIKGALIQYTRQLPGDSYDMHEVAAAIKGAADIPIVTDDNYAVMKVKDIGVQCGADLSCFSAFKLLGPEGIGMIVGKEKYISRLISENYSGGMQVQGHEALDVLHGLTYAPVALAVQAGVGEECVRRLESGEIPGIRRSFVANAQSKVILVELEEPVAEKVLLAAEKLGAAPYPVGAESKYELAPMFYRISGTFRAWDPELQHRMIRINPMRAGADTVIRILKEAMESVTVCS